MKISVCVTIFVAICFSCASAQVLDGNPEHVVRAILDSKVAGISYGGIEDKELSRMGDAACVALTKVIAGRGLTPTQIDRALLVIHLSFGAPQIVQDRADWEPRTALFVLNYLQSLTASPKQLQAIQETRTYVQGQYNRAIAAQGGTR